MKTKRLNPKHLIISTLLVLAGTIGVPATAAASDATLSPLPPESSRIVDQHAGRAEANGSTFSGALSLKIFQRRVMQALENSRWSIGATPAVLDAHAPRQHVDPKRSETSILPMPTYDGGVFVELEVAF